MKSIEFIPDNLRTGFKPVIAVSKRKFILSNPGIERGKVLAENFCGNDRTRHGSG